MSVWRDILDDEALGLMMSDGPQSGPLYDFVFDRPEATFEPWTTPAVLAAQLAAHGITATPTETFPLQETSGATVEGSEGTTLTKGADAHLGRKALGLHDGDGSLDSFVGPVFKRTSATATLAAGSSATYDKTTASFAVLFLVRLNGLSSAAGYSLLGKAATSMTTGWDVEVANTGRVWARAADGVGSASIQLTGTDLSDGAWHYVCAIWDQTADLLRLITDFEQGTANIASLGSLTTSAVFEIGRTRGITSAGWQCAGFAIFDGADAEALNDKAKLDAWFAAQVNGTTPKTGWTFTRATVLGAPLIPDADGERLHIFGKTRPAYGYGSLLGGTQLGYFSSVAFVNMLLDSSIDTANWTSASSPTVTADYGECPRGLQHSYRIVKTDGESRRQSTAIALVSGTSYVFSVWYKSSGSLPSIWITDDSYTTVKASATAGASDADGTWRRLSVAWTADASANFRFSISSAAKTVTPGDAEFQYAMVSVGTHAMPFVPAYGAAAALAGSILYRDLALTGFATSGAMLVNAQGFSGGAPAQQWISVLSANSGGSLQRGRYLAMASSEAPLCGWYDDSAVFQAQAGATAVDPSAVSEWLGQWSNGPSLLGTKELHVRAGASEQTADTTLSGSDPQRAYVGSSQTGGNQFIGPIQRVRIYRQPIEAP